jgi:hypothetical protein
MPNSEANEESELFDRFVSADGDAQDEILDQLYGKCRAEARRTPQRGYSIDPKLLLLSVMVEAAVALGSIVGEPSRPFKGGRV